MPIYEQNLSKPITGFALTAANYEEALDLLKQRYGKRTVIQRAHVNGMLNITPIHNEKDAGRLRAMYDNLETHYRGLNAMGVEENTYSSIVVPAILEKLPQALRLTLTRGTKYLEWSMKELLQALLKEVELREAHDLTPSTRATPARESDKTFPLRRFNRTVFICLHSYTITQSDSQFLPRA